VLLWSGPAKMGLVIRVFAGCSGLARSGCRLAMAGLPLSSGIARCNSQLPCNRAPGRRRHPDLVAWEMRRRAAVRNARKAINHKPSWRKSPSACRQGLIQRPSFRRSSNKTSFASSCSQRCSASFNQLLTMAGASGTDN